MKRRKIFGLCLIFIIVIVLILTVISALYIVGHMGYVQSKYSQIGSVEPVKELNREMKWFLSWLVLVFFVLGILLVVFINRFFVNPITELSQATKEIIEGNLDFEIKKSRNDEIGTLQEDFEAMRKYIKVTTEKLSQNAKNARDMMSNITHDLKTPLTAIKGYSEGLLDGVAVNKEMQKKYVKTIHNKACLMEEMVEDLSYFSKLDHSDISYNFRLIPIRGFIEDCLGEIEMDISVGGVTLQKKFPEGDDEEIVMDASEIRRVLLNIIGNSMKYMDKAEGVIEVKLSFEDSMACISVRDNGRGISEDDITHIFERFYRADQSRGTKTGGTGLGLAIAESIVRDHGGSISAESELGEYTEIKFSLPRDVKHCGK